MLSMSVRLTGDRQLERQFRALGQVAVDKIHEAVRAGAVIVKNDAKRRVPKRTSTLSRSIHFESKLTRTGAVAEVGTDVEYAKYVEFGTGIHAEGGIGRQTPWAYKVNGRWYFTRGQRPQPYLRPALSENREAVVQEIRDAMADLMQRAVQ